MDSFTPVFDALYQRFLLRDVAAKAVPGGIVLYALDAALFHGQGRAALVEIDVVSRVAFTAGAAWMAGLAIQSATSWIFGSIRSSSEDGREEDIHFMRSSSADERAFYERYAVLKEASRNFASALTCLLLIGLWAAVASGVTFSNIDWLRSVAATAFASVAILALIRQYRESRKDQIKIREAVISLGPPTGSTRHKASKSERASR